MKNYILLFSALLLFEIATGQIEDYDDHFDCVHVEENQGASGNMMGISTNGSGFTPKGDMRALIIYVDFPSDKYDEIDDEDYDLSQWPKDRLFPYYNDQSEVDLTTGKIAWAHEDESEFSPIGSPSPEAYNNISEYYYHMSNGQFKFYAETLKDPISNLPITVTVDPTGASNNTIRNKVFEELNEIYPLNYDWGRFDIRTRTFPNYTQDQSATFTNPNPDGKIDYIFLIFKNNNTWAPHPNGNSSGSGWFKGYAGASGTIGTYSNNAGLTVNHFEKIYPRMEAYVHEIAHTYYQSPHTNHTNNVHGEYYKSNNGWGMMHGYGDFMALSNAWERWYSGWTEITYDLNSTLTTPTTYNLKDYMDYGQSMRLKLPHTDDQFIWLENHDNEDNPFYQRASLRNDKFGEIIPQPKKGLYGFVERIASSRTVLNRFEYGANGIKMIYGKGNFDYVFDNFYQRDYLWDSYQSNVNIYGENAYNGQNEASYMRHDFGNMFDEGENVILYGSGTNGGESDIFNDGSVRNEGTEITTVNHERTYARFGPNANLPNRKISAFTNPALTNFQEINDPLSSNTNNHPTPNTLAPVILHSLSITPSTNLDGSIDILVDYNDGVIEDDFRMTGNIYLPINENIKLKSNKELLLNQSLSPNKIVADENGSFSDPTVFITAHGGQLSLLREAKVVLDESSTMIYNDGSTLQMDNLSKIYIRNGSLLCIKEGANVLLHPSAKIIVQDGFINVHPSIDISANIEYTDPVPANPQVVNTLQYCEVNSPEYIHSIDGTNVGGFVCFASGEIIVENTDNVKLTSEKYVSINTVFEVKEGGFFEAEILTIADNCDAEFFFGDGLYAPTFATTNTGSNDKINSFENPFNVAVAPNPSKGVFNVTIDKQLDHANYTLYDFSGNTIISDQLENKNTFSINKYGLPKGIYLLKIESNEGVMTKKVIIY